jgi:hypothetical protein
MINLIGVKKKRKNLSDTTQGISDKTALHIGGMTYGKLILYKKHYQKTGEVKIPERFIQNKKLVDKFYEYIESDD